MRDEIEELWSLAEECREWARPVDDADKTTAHVRACKAQFWRLAKKLDAIAKTLSTRDFPPHHRQGTFGEEPT
jgi:hypothetical protein